MSLEPTGVTGAPHAPSNGIVRAPGEKVESPVFRQSGATNDRPDHRAILINRSKVWKGRLAARRRTRQFGAVSVYTHFLRDDAATRALGAALGATVRRGDIVCLSGPLGAGKTTLARGVIGRLTGAEDAPSPTFPLVETYRAATFDLWHFDLYRLETASDVYELGIEDAFASGACLIEWPERIADLIPDDALLIRLDLDGGGRKAIIDASPEWCGRLAAAGIMTQA